MGKNGDIVRGDTYRSISGTAEGLYKDRGSRFIAKAYPVESEADVKGIVDTLKKEYHDARHHCFAYRLGLTGDRYRASDDGEPPGSAGRQILGQIDSAGLSDVLVVVVRYFGGIKLGIPGLVRAYKSASMDALTSASVVEKTASVSFSLKFPYEKMPSVMKVVKDLDIPQTGKEFGETCEITLRVRESLVPDFLDKMEKLDIFMDRIL